MEVITLDLQDGYAIKVAVGSGLEAGRLLNFVSDAMLAFESYAEIQRLESELKELKALVERYDGTLLRAHGFVLERVK